MYKKLFSIILTISFCFSSYSPAFAGKENISQEGKTNDQGSETSEVIGGGVMAAVFSALSGGASGFSRYVNNIFMITQVILNLESSISSLKKIVMPAVVAVKRYSSSGDVFVKSIEELEPRLDAGFAQISGHEFAKKEIKKILFSIVDNFDRIDRRDSTGRGVHIIYIVGNSGNGKTKTAKIIAEAMLKNLKCLRTVTPGFITPSSYGGGNVMDQLFALGINTGYKSAAGAQRIQSVTDFVIENEQAMIIFDDAEKIFRNDIEGMDEKFRTMVDEGFLYLPSEHRVELHKLVIIITSNESRESLMIRHAGYDQQQDEEPTDGNGGEIKQEFVSRDKFGRTSTVHDVSYLNRVKIVELGPLSASDYKGVSKKVFYEQTYLFKTRDGIKEIYLHDSATEKLTYDAIDTCTSARSVERTVDESLSYGINILKAKFAQESFLSLRGENLIFWCAGDGCFKLSYISPLDLAKLGLVGDFDFSSSFIDQQMEEIVGKENLFDESDLYEIQEQTLQQLIQKRAINHVISQPIQEQTVSTNKKPSSFQWGEGKG
ncbi:MAG: ATP-binding protein [Oscillospiraceae bacterium]|jgi:hypothetical protein|nr:ATP-binding protein [Oscillospiraceae bacterium]